MHVTWRHAVVKDLHPDDSVGDLKAIADELLTEWGSARGLTALGPVVLEKWNYGARIGFGMSFGGRKTAAGLSRLQGFGTFGLETLRGREEAWPPLDRTPLPPEPAELAVARERENTERLGE